jgi:hypothetical protein
MFAKLEAYGDTLGKPGEDIVWYTGCRVDCGKTWCCMEKEGVER